MFVPKTEDEEGTLFGRLWQESWPNLTKGIERRKKDGWIDQYTFHRIKRKFVDQIKKSQKFPRPPRWLSGCGERRWGFGYKK